MNIKEAIEEDGYEKLKGEFLPLLKEQNILIQTKYEETVSILGDSNELDSFLIDFRKRSDFNDGNLDSKLAILQTRRDSLENKLFETWVNKPNDQPLVNLSPPKMFEINLIELLIKNDYRVDVSALIITFEDLKIKQEELFKGVTKGLISAVFKDSFFEQPCPDLGNKWFGEKSYRVNSL